MDAAATGAWPRLGRLPPLMREAAVLRTLWSCAVIGAAAVVLCMAPGGLGRAVEPAAALTEELRAFARTEHAAVERIGRRIWQNEAAGRVDGLVHWLPGEHHLSLGIGHVIWYPAGRRDRFHESFPDLMAFLRQRGVALPAWLTATGACPWPTRAAFLAARADPRLLELRRLLATTVADQAAYLIDRLARALPEILASAPDRAARARLAARLGRVLRTADGGIAPEGVYALTDYVNFKGEGTSATERYRGEGWGLLQVLETMADPPAGDLAAFAAAAAAVLTRRVALAPPGRGEERWLGGWLKRVAGYVEEGRLAAGAAPGRERARPPGDEGSW